MKKDLGFTEARENEVRSREAAGQTILLASHNGGKLRELKAMCASLDLRLRSQAELGVPEAAETGDSFLENALIKARNACRHGGLPAIADDSGLEVAALGGAPGVYSARYAGEGAGDDENLHYLLGKLKGVPPSQRNACFRCLLVYLRDADDEQPIVCEGAWQGFITEEPCGSGGFGYDPVFYLPQLGCTSAQLDAAHKNRLSHRGQALRKLVKALGC